MKWSPIILSTTLLAAFIGCSEKEKSTNSNPDIIPEAPAVVNCAVDLSEAKITELEKILAEIKLNPGTIIGQNYSKLGRSQWISSEDYSNALIQYDKALSNTEHYCNALLGKGMVYGLKAVNQPDFSAFIENFESNQELKLDWKNKESLFSGMYKLAHTSSTDSDLNWADFQDLLINSVYPQLDSAISYLSSAYNSEDNAYVFEIDTKKTELDRGDIGPALGQLEIYKAVVTLIVSRNNDAQLAESSEWIQTLASLVNTTYDASDAKQNEALEHIVSLYKGENSFLGVKSDWIEKLASVPDLIQSALDHIKGGFEYGIAEYSNSNEQPNDPYRVGVTAKEDISHTALAVVVSNLESIQKDFSGTKTIGSGEGTLEIKIGNLFKEQNFSDYAPYIKIKPFNEWSDESAYDTTFTTIFPSDTSANIAVSTYGINVGEDVIFTSPSTTSSDSIAWTINRVPKANPEQSIVLGKIRFAKKGTCSFDTQQDGTDSWVNIAIENCKLEGDYAKFIESVIASKSSPFEFTDANGTTTFIPGNDKVMSIKDLTGKVVFPDPTFGGVFPGLSNENIWTKVSEIEDSSVNSLYKTDCTDKSSPYKGIGYSICRDGKPLFPTNPGDINYLSYLGRWIN